jgi:kumamolisin
VRSTARHSFAEALDRQATAQTIVALRVNVEEQMPEPPFPKGSTPGTLAVSDYQPVPGSEIEPLLDAYIVGRANPSQRIEVTLLLRPRPRPVEEGLVSAREIGSLMPQERGHLTRQAVAGSFGADRADVAEVERFARRWGLRIVGQNLGARTVHLCGAVANFSRAFRTPLARYRYSRGIYRGRTGPVHIPRILQGVVHGVFGLDNRPAARPHFRRRRRLGGVWAHVQGTSYSPPEVAKLYNFPSDVNGAGQCIGIIELGGGFALRDLHQYFRKLGITPPTVTAVSVNGGQNRPTGNPNGPDGEVMLDIEVAGAVAPGAKIAVYFAPNTTQGFLRAINRAIHDRVHRPSVISISWGGPESGWTQQALNAFDQAFQTAATMGVTIVAAAGDGGSSDGVRGRLAHADFPASSPYVLGGGGTRLDSAQGAITAEVVWNDGPQGGAGGGGISDFFELPNWQAQAGVPPSVNPGGRVGRGVPDLSGDADPNTGYQVRVDGVDAVIGGTSAVAPLLAGLIALLNEKLGTSVGYSNPLLYTTLAKANAFHDVTKGNNDMNGLVGGYNSSRGWDAASGLGTPNGNVILAALAGPKKESVTPEVTRASVASPQAPREEGSLARKQTKDG